MKKLFLLSIVLAPNISFAAEGFSDFRAVVMYLVGLINLAIPVVGALALFVFIKGLVAFIAKSGDSASHAEGKNLMIWGIVGLFVMVSFLSLISLARNTLGLQDTPRSPGGFPLIKSNQ
jgi:hypothetical protein